MCHPLPSLLRTSCMETNQQGSQGSCQGMAGVSFALLQAPALLLEPSPEGSDLVPSLLTEGPRSCLSLGLLSLCALSSRRRYLAALQQPQQPLPQGCLGEGEKPGRLGWTHAESSTSLIDVQQVEEKLHGLLPLPLYLRQNPLLQELQVHRACGGWEGVLSEILGPPRPAFTLRSLPTPCLMLKAFPAFSRFLVFLSSPSCKGKELGGCAWPGF